MIYIPPPPPPPPPPPGPQARGNVNHRRDRLQSDVTNLYHGKRIEHLTRFEDRNNVWPLCAANLSDVVPWAHDTQEV